MKILAIAVKTINIFHHPMTPKMFFNGTKSVTDVLQKSVKSVQVWLLELPHVSSSVLSQGFWFYGEMTHFWSKGANYLQLVFWTWNFWVPKYWTSTIIFIEVQYFDKNFHRSSVFLAKNFCRNQHSFGLIFQMVSRNLV